VGYNEKNSPKQVDEVRSLKPDCLNLIGIEREEELQRLTK
jgi:hypothetical protein